MTTTLLTMEVDQAMTGTPKRRTDRLTPEQRAQVRATVAAWAPLTEAQRVQVATLFAGRFDAPRGAG